MTRRRTKKSRPSTPIATAVPTRCPRCGSTNRDPYHNTRRLDTTGTLPCGSVYSAVIWRRTRCHDCGQTRIDKTWIFRDADNSTKKTRKKSRK